MISDPAEHLRPVASCWREWGFHYPVYPNSYCLAYNLAALIDDETHDWRSLRGCLIQHDWASGLPRFTRRLDYQFFVAEQTFLDQVRAQTNFVVFEPFTNYSVELAFLRNKSGHDALRFASLSEAVEFAIHENAQRIIVVTDIPPTAEIVELRLRTLCDERSFNPSIQIRGWWSREIADFYDADALKFYVLGAGGTQWFRNRGARYAQISLRELPAVTTYMCVRYAADASVERANEMLSTIREYYGALFSWADRCTREWTAIVDKGKKPGLLSKFCLLKPPKSLAGIGEKYSRIAQSSRQFDPFELNSTDDGKTLVGPTLGSRSQDMDFEYLSLLARHHVSVPSQ